MGIKSHQGQSAYLSRWSSYSLCVTGCQTHGTALATVILTSKTRLGRVHLKFIHPGPRIILVTLVTSRRTCAKIQRGLGGKHLRGKAVNVTSPQGPSKYSSLSFTSSKKKSSLWRIAVSVFTGPLLQSSSPGPPLHSKSGV